MFYFDLLFRFGDGSVVFDGHFLQRFGDLLGVIRVFLHHFEDLVHLRGHGLVQGGHFVQKLLELHQPGGDRVKLEVCPLRLEHEVRRHVRAVAVIGRGKYFTFGQFSAVILHIFCQKILGNLAFHIFPKAQVASNKNAHKL